MKPVPGLYLVLTPRHYHLSSSINMDLDPLVREVIPEFFTRNTQGMTIF
jgi:hypothetical protein